MIQIPGPATSGSAYSFRTVTFKAVNNSDDDQAFDLTTITPVKSDGTIFDSAAGAGKTRCTGSVKIRKMLNNDGDYDTEYQYFSTENYDGRGWYVGAKTADSKKVAAGTVYIRKGEGLLVTCTVKGGAGLQVSGEVELMDTSFVIPGPATSGSAYSFSGNSTPVAIDLNDITPLKLDGTIFDSAAGAGKTRCTGSVKIRRMLNNDGDYDTEYQYFSTENYDGRGWYVGAKAADSKKVARDVMTLEPGEGLLVTCTVKGGARLKMKNPMEPAPVVEE